MTSAPGAVVPDMLVVEGEITDELCRTIGTVSFVSSRMAIDTRLVVTLEEPSAEVALTWTVSALVVRAS